MSILDDAIREHLELKRARGADESVLKKLEDQAFGPPGRPDDENPFAEAPTEFLTAPATGADEAAADAMAEPSGRREPTIADLQEAPPPPKPEEPTPAPEAEAATDAPTPIDEEAPAIEQTMPVPHAEPASEPEPAAEPAAAAEPGPEIDAGHTTEERHAIAEQPTEFFDVEAEIDASADPRSPSDEQLVDAELADPRLAPVDPLGPIVDTGPDAELAAEPEDDEGYEEDDFFSEQRLSDELNQALEAPVTDEHEVFAPQPEPEPAAAESEPEPEPAAAEPEPKPEPELEPEAAGPPTEEHTPLSPVEEPTAIYDVEHHAVAEEELELEAEEEEHLEEEHSPFVEHDEDEDAPPAPPAAAKDEDVLENTPDFLEDAPEDDDLWFEQKPPKDFDFDD